MMNFAEKKSKQVAKVRKQVSHLLIYQVPACFTDPLTIIDMLLRSSRWASARTRTVSKNDEFCIKNEEFCV